MSLLWRTSAARELVLTLQVLVIVPTRELCQQVCDVANQFGRQHGIRATAVFGGSSKSIQMQKLREGKSVVRSVLATLWRTSTWTREVNG